MEAGLRQPHRRAKLTLAQVISIAGVGAVALVIGLSVFRARTRDLAVCVQVVEAVLLEQTVQIVGRLRLHDQVDLSARVASEIETIYVNVGDEVHAGQLLVQLKRDHLLAELHRADFSVREAKVAHELAEIKLERMTASANRARTLSKQQLTSVEDGENAERDLRSATLERDRARLVVEQANALLQRAQEDVKSTQITAPFAGSVVALWAKIGQATLPSSINVPASRILTLGGTGAMELVGKVTEFDITRLQVGQKAKAKFHALSDLPMSARIAELSRIGTSDNEFDSTRYEVSVTVDEIPEGTVLRPGMTATIVASVAARDKALAVYRQAVVDVGAEQMVADNNLPQNGQVVADRSGQVWMVINSRARSRKIRTAVQNDIFIDVVDGLVPGDRIIVAPNAALRLLREGTRVHIEQELTARSKTENSPLYTLRREPFPK